MRVASRVLTASAFADEGESWWLSHKPLESLVHATQEEQKKRALVQEQEAASQAPQPAAGKARQESLTLEVAAEAQPSDEEPQQALPVPLVDEAPNT